jgi:hypothetical protein
MMKMTYSVAIDNALAGNLTDEVVERLHDLQAQLAKRGSGKKGLTKTQKENVDKKEQILDILRNEPGLTATEVGKAIGESCQRASALLAQMGDPNGKVKGDGRVRREQVGKTVRFYAVD